MTKKAKGVGAYAKFWMALGVAVTSLIVAASDGRFTPEEIAAVGPQFVTAALVFVAPNVPVSAPRALSQQVVPQ